MAISDELRVRLIDEFRSQSAHGTGFDRFLAGDAVIRAAWLESLTSALCREVTDGPYTQIDRDTIRVVVDAAVGVHTAASTAARSRYQAPAE